MSAAPAQHLQHRSLAKEYLLGLGPPCFSTVHYGYMALAKESSVLREAMLISFELRCFGAAEYADIFRSHAKRAAVFPAIYS